MLSVVFKNPELAAKRLGCSKTSIYSWLNGHTPNLSSMMKVYEVYDMHISLQYMYNFFTLVSHLLKEEDLEEMSEIINISGLTKDDKDFLKEYFKSKFWKSEGKK